MYEKILAFIQRILKTNLYRSLTDIARYKSDMPHDVVKNWLGSRDTIEFLGLWESLHNLDYKQEQIHLLCHPQRYIC